MLIALTQVLQKQLPYFVVSSALSMNRLCEQCPKAMLRYKVVGHCLCGDMCVALEHVLGCW